MNTAITLSLPLHDDQPAREYEWLITNGLGGYASGSLAGVNTRRYHGIFVPNLQQPKGRHVMISRLDETIIMGEQEYQLGGADFDNNLNGTATQWLKSFTVDNNTARWLYEIGPLQLERTLMMPHQQNTVCIRYRVLTDVKLSMHLRPYLPFRRQDAELPVEVDHHFKIAIHGEQSEVTLDNLSIFIATQPGPIHFISETHTADKQLLTREQARGYACHESTTSPGYYLLNLDKEHQASFIATAHPWENIEKDINNALDAEARRIHAIAVRAEVQRDESHEAQDDMVAKLTVAADQFLVQPGSRLHEESVAAAEGHQLRSVIAGYHWFSDWGRDTMIALEGLMLCTGRFQEARATLLTFSHYVKDGLLPNLFPEGERVGLYHTVDATLWYFHAIHRYIQRSADDAILTEMLP
ncbi:MAG TPA: glycogen debranching enzyme N-terminal domain-containing protein, partial [Steroidobacteraceae bacterium]|nr:glycogen debranching enzyme N-terminal domain-containing protein [Steroidobacteraceae bacterium]